MVCETAVGFVICPDGGAMYGAILGDIIGSPYEYDKAKSRRNLPLFSERSRVTDDTMMTVAIADALMSEQDFNDDDSLRYAFINRMRYWGRLYPNVGYGSRFRRWLLSENPTPFESSGNTCAVRVSPIAWLCDTLEQTRHIAALSAEVTHHHPEAVRGAEAVAGAIFMAGHGASKDEIAAYMTDEFHYDLGCHIENLQNFYPMDSTCKGSVPGSIVVFLESRSFEEAVRTTVALGGDTDTTSAIVGSMAEAFYGIPKSLIAEVFNYTRPCIQKVIHAFTHRVEQMRGIQAFMAS